jgi:hypothetical protein
MRLQFLGVCVAAGCLAGCASERIVESGGLTPRTESDVGSLVGKGAAEAIKIAGEHGWPSERSPDGVDALNLSYFGATPSGPGLSMTTQNIPTRSLWG